MEAKQLDAMIADAEFRLKRLRVLYDQWFTGLERIEPQQQRDRFEQQMKAIHREPTANTAMRFRVQQLQQRYITYSTYWKRVTRQIEEGTYKRDVLRAKRRRAARTQDDVVRKQEAFELDVDIDLDVDNVLNEALASVMTPSAMPPAQLSEEASSSIAQAVAGGSRPSSRPIAGYPAQGPAPQRPAGSSSRRFPRPAGLRGTPANQGSAPSLVRGVSDRIPLPAAVPVSHQPPAPQATSHRPGSPKPLTEAARKPLTEAARKPPAAVASSGSAVKPGRTPTGVSDQQIKHIYDRYIAARKQNAERIDNVRVESIAKSVRGMMPKLTKKHGGKKIDFEVVVRGGKVALKPVPK